MEDFDIDPNSEDLSFYEPPSLDTLTKAGVEGKHFFGYFKKWVPQWAMPLEMGSAQDWGQ